MWLAGAPAASPAAGTGGKGQRLSPEFRRSVSPFGEPPSAAEMRSQDQSAARASRTAIRTAGRRYVEMMAKCDPNGYGYYVW